MKAKKSIKELQTAGWKVDTIGEQKQHFRCAGTGHIGSRPKSASYVATLPGCDYRIEFFVQLAQSVEDDDCHNDIQVLHKNDPSNAVGCMRFKTVKRAMDTAVKYSDELQQQKARRHSMDALFDGSNAHKLIG